MLVLSTSAQAADNVTSWADGHSHVCCAVAETGEAARALAEKHNPEVLLVDLLFGGSEGIATGIALARTAPGAEVVFMVEAVDTPEVRAAQDIGITRFVATGDLGQWLHVALEPLGRLARSRRIFEDAQRAVAQLPAWRVEPTSREMRLGVAERRYREAFLRASLARAGGRRAAAQLAGVPYTTFCVMLRKLGIAPGSED